MAQPEFWISRHPEITIPDILDHQSIRAQEQPSGVFTVRDASSGASNMAEELASDGVDSHHYGTRDTSLDESHGALGTGPRDMVEHHGKCRKQEEGRGAEYGNSKGSFATCLLCHQRTKWDPDLEKWALVGPSSSQRSSLPAPSFSNNTYLGPPKSTTSKSKAKPLRSSARSSSNTSEAHLESGMNQEERDYWMEMGKSIMAEELSHRAHLRSTGRLDEYLAEQDRIIQEGRLAAACIGYRPRGHGKSGAVGLGEPAMMSVGQKKHMLGQLRKAKHAMEAEMKLYESLATSHRTHRSRVDILETFAGNAPVSKRASSFGLIAVRSMDYNTGVDLGSHEGQSQCKRMVDHLKPLVLLQSLHCMHTMDFAPGQLQLCWPTRGLGTA